MKKNQNLQQKLSDLLKSLDTAAVECDGFTRLASSVLSLNDIPHAVKIGALISDEADKSIPVHFWIEIDDLVIDYRARMWVGETAPYGVVKKPDIKGWDYQGEEVVLKSISPALFCILSQKNLNDFILTD